MKILWFYRFTKLLMGLLIISSLCQCSEGEKDTKSDLEKLTTYEKEITMVITVLNARVFNLRDTLQSGDRSAIHEAALKLKSAYFVSFRINTFRPSLQNEIADNYANRLAESFWTYRETIKAFANSIEILTTEGRSFELEEKIKGELNLLQQTSKDILVNLDSAYKALGSNPKLNPTTPDASQYFNQRTSFP